MTIEVELLPCKFSDLGDSDQAFLLHAAKAKELSYAPYSTFFVGCSVELTSGQIVTGANQENSSFPSGLCAERVALFQCAKDLSDSVQRIAITAHSDNYMVPDPLVPCAACLQVISDIRYRQQKPIEIWMWDGAESVFIAKDVDQFLPFHFELTEK